MLIKTKKFSKHHDFSEILVDSFTTKTYVVQFHYDTVSRLGAYNISKYTDILQQGRLSLLLYTNNINPAERKLLL